jgi:hypothetical protein
MFVWFGFGYMTVWARLRLDLRGTIIASVDTPRRNAPRYATIYTLRAPDGAVLHYLAGATDASLSRGLPVGTVLAKSAWQLGYSVDGNWVGFPIGFYLVVLTIGAAAIVAGIARLPWRRWLLAGGG